jgi:hypothetical protein
MRFQFGTAPHSDRKFHFLPVNFARNSLLKIDKGRDGLNSSDLIGEIQKLKGTENEFQSDGFSAEPDPGFLRSG